MDARKTTATRRPERAPATRITWASGGRASSARAVRAAVAAALRHGKRPDARLEIVFVDDPTLAALHARWLDDPAPTDVIAFDLGDDGVGAAGEIYVSIDRARAVARRRGQPVERELLLYAIHGALHLCGFDDHEPRDRARMRRAERAVLASLERSGEIAFRTRAQSARAKKQRRRPRGRAC